MSYSDVGEGCKYQSFPELPKDSWRGKKEQGLQNPLRRSQKIKSKGVFLATKRSVGSKALRE